MKTIKTYQITKEQYENTEYRPDVENVEFKTEDNWCFADILSNMCIPFVYERHNDIIVYRIFTEYKDNSLYICEIID